MNIGILLVWMVALTATFLQLRPLDDMDLFTQIGLGCGKDLLAGGVENGGVNTAPRANPGWLAQKLYCAVDRYTGLPWLRFMHAWLFALSFLFPALMYVRDQTKSPAKENAQEGELQKRVSVLPLILGWILALLPALSNTSSRPQAFALFFFGFLYWYWRSESRGLRLLVTTSLVALLWQNFHLSLSLAGLLWVSLFPGALDRSSGTRRVSLLCVPVIVAIAYFTTPLGFDVLAITRSNLLSSRFLGITEWLPPFDPAIRQATWPFLVIALIAIPLLLRSYLPGQKRYVYSLPTILFFAFAISATRFILFWSVVALPSLIEILSRFTQKLRAARPRSIFARTAPVGSSRLTTVALALIVSALPAIVSYRVVDPRIPLSCISQLRNVMPQGRVYNYREWGGPLSYFGSPDWSLTIDGRLYLFTVDRLERYNSEARGEVDVGDIQANYRPDAFVLRRDFHRGLVSKLEREPEWQSMAVPSEPLCAAFIRR